VTHTASLFDGIPTVLPAELTDCLLRSPALRIERIVSRGHCSPPGFWYDQPENEWVLLVSGAAALRFETETEPVLLREGMHLHIPARVRHRVEWTRPDADTVWLAVFY
jgi:cupin 2 domain-containing protein